MSSRFSRPYEPEPSPCSRRWGQWVVTLAILAGLSFGFWQGYAKYQRLRAHALEALTILRRFEALASESSDIAHWDVGQLSSLRMDLGHLEETLIRVKAEVRFFLPLCPYLAWVPGVGDEIAAAPALLDMAIRLASAGWWSLAGIEPLAASAIGQQRAELDDLLGRALEQLVLRAPYFLEAQEALDRALAERATFTSEGFLPQLRSLVDRLDRYLPLLQMGLRGAVIAPELLGANGLRRYLVLAQNNHELRATGGFISAIGLLTVEQGKIVGIDFRDAQVLDDFSKAHPPPPEPLARYMEAGILLLRDGNWSPDLPTSARVIQSLYRQDQGISTDGVIAVDVEALRLLVDALGPLYLVRRDEWVDGSNVLDRIMEYWGPNPEEGITFEWWLRRKDFMDDLVTAMMTKVREAPADLDPMRLAQALRQALAEKHLLIYLNEETAAERLARSGWDGRFLLAPQDYLMVVDSNLGYNKVNPNIEQAIHYLVTILDEGHAWAEVRITYRNRSSPRDEPCVHRSSYDLVYRAKVTYAEIMEGCYWDYVRVYAPAGSQLRQVTGSTEPVDVAREHDKAVFGTFFVVPPGEERELRFVYDLPSDVAWLAMAGDYNLVVQKQAGTLAIPLRVEVTLPPAMVIKSASPGVQVVGERTLVYESALSSDQALRVALEKERASWLTLGFLAMGLLFLISGLLLRVDWGGRGSQMGVA